MVIGSLELHNGSRVFPPIAAFTKIGKKYDILHKSKDEIVAKYGL